jgi:hypothetical protein
MVLVKPIMHTSSALAHAERSNDALQYAGNGLVKLESLWDCELGVQHLAINSERSE